MAISRVQGQRVTSKISDDEVRRALANGASSGLVIRNLYDLWKRHHTGFSLAILCQRAEMPSKGYLSDCMAGKRILNIKYRDSLVKAFKLKSENAHYLKVLIAYENEKDERKRLILQSRLANAKKAINVQFMKMSKTYDGIFTALEVFCGFGLFKNRPTWHQLETYFSDTPKARLLDALFLLKSMNLITEAPSGHYETKTSHFVLGEAESDFSHVEFIKLALAHASDNVENWFSQKDRSYFASSILSVRMEHFEKAIESLKSRMLLVQTDLESSDADTLVRFNVQIYPTR